MRTNLEPLKYSTLAPSRFVVYLHPEEYARVEGIVPVLEEQTSRALGEALAKLNNRPVYRKYLDRLTGALPPVENVAREWQVEFHPDADGELRLDSLHQGVTLDQVRAGMAWEPRVAEQVATTPAPTDAELRLIREELDPGSVYTA